MTSPIRWSPMTCIPFGPTLTKSGLLQLDTSDGEVELITIGNVQIRMSQPLPILNAKEGTDATSNSSSSIPHQVGNWSERDLDLVCTLTTHRIVFLPSSSGSSKSLLSQGARHIPLNVVQGASPDGGSYFNISTYKILLRTRSYGDVRIVFQHFSGNRSNDRDEVLSGIHKSLSRKAWEESKRQQESDKLKNVNHQRKVGVDAIISKNKERHKEAARVSDAAFANDDVESFLKEARELVNVIHKYVATLEKDKNKSGRSNTGEDEDLEKLSVMLEDMGMASALSKKKLGGMYHQQLARQLADFLQRGNRLKEAGGMMTLTDVYCLFNRARGTNLISPEDLLQAMALMKELELGMSQRDFPSGVIIVQDDEFDDDTLAKRLVEFCNESGKGTDTSIGGVTSLDVSRAFKISAMLANEQLLSAERMAFLCRDVTLEGTRFFPNLFVSEEFNFQ